MNASRNAIAAAAAFVAGAVMAQDVKKVEKVTVTASPLGRGEAEMAQPATVLSEDELRRKRAASLGDTLAQEPGVQSSAFGAAAGRPVIRGLDGPRIRVLENGVGTLDASSVSPDHAVATESLNAEQVEILRGPASLLYGSGAIGGVVNVVSGLIPREPAAALRGAVELRGASGNRERTGAFRLDGGEGPLAWHLDGFSRRSGDYRIPGDAWREDAAHRHEDDGDGHGEGDHGHDATGPRGRLPGSDVRARGAGAGASWVSARGYLGAGVQGLRNEYGVPSGEGVRIDLRQDRLESAGEHALAASPFDRVRYRIARSDYRHREIEANGEVATTFTNDAVEGRVEARHRPVAGWNGTLGLQFQSREMAAEGDEAILPRTRARATAMFLVQEREAGAWTFDWGIRAERESRRPDGALPARAFSLATPAVGAVWRIGDYRLGLSATQAQRAPSVEELYSNGAHHATATFDIGDATLRKEVSRNVDVTLRKAAGETRWRLNVFANRVRDYVYGASVDADGDGSPDRVGHEGELAQDGEFLVQRFAQARARFHGAEVEWAWRPAPGDAGIRLFGDYVRGRLEDGGNLPRISAPRAGLALDGRRGDWSGTLTAIHGFEQRRTSSLETRTPSYTRVDAEVAWRAAVGPASVTFFLQGTNLLDEEIRLHTSHLKDVAPSMGRSFTLGVRGEF